MKGRNFSSISNLNWRADYFFLNVKSGGEIVQYFYFCIGAQKNDEKKVSLNNTFIICVDSHYINRLIPLSFSFMQNFFSGIDENMKTSFFSSFKCALSLKHYSHQTSSAKLYGIKFQKPILFYLYSIQLSFAVTKFKYHQM
jgi:hypothetical protein